jgi:hypothetical protein
VPGLLVAQNHRRRLIAGESLATLFVYGTIYCDGNKMVVGRQRDQIPGSNALPKDKLDPYAVPAPASAAARRLCVLFAASRSGPSIKCVYSSRSVSVQSPAETASLNANGERVEDPRRVWGNHGETGNRETRSTPCGKAPRASIAPERAQRDGERFSALFSAIRIC